MLEQLINLVRQNAQQEIIENPAIPNSRNEAVIGETTNSILSGLQNMVAGGGFSTLLNMFTSKDGIQQNNGIVQSLSGNVINGLMDKLGLDNGIAKSVAAALVPKVLGGLISNTQDPNNPSFNLNSLMGLLTSGNATNQTGTGGFDFQGLLGKVMSGGLDQNQDGSVGIGDVVSLVTGSASQNQKQYGGFGNLITKMLTQ